ncbi:hypothetical protein Syun_007476 [Stephania yunnanensis]|uniref:Uncharacterized protein n=1 Tax=Stephania yunnanensis TaxID=152371 RepID=A0AAP0KZK8_9MAGN
MSQETQNSVKEEPRATSGCGVAGPEQRRRRSRAQAAAAEDRGGEQVTGGGGSGSEQRRWTIAEASSVGGTGVHGVGGTRGRGALLMAGGGENVGAAAADKRAEQRRQRRRPRSCSGAEGEYRGEARAPPTISAGARRVVVDGVADDRQIRRVTVDVDDGSGRRRRRWWQGLCGGGDLRRRRTF